jgi:ditrans,polycis-polyprenyl diphosphate synthase
MGAKQTLVLCLIRSIEWVVNNPCISLILQVANRLRGMARRKGREKPQRSSSRAFEGLSLAFICDGNRRFLRKYRIKARNNKQEGVEKIREMIEFGYKNRLRELSFFCFALKNFKRPGREVSELMSLVTSGEHGLLDSPIAIRVKVYGRLELLEAPVREEFNRLQEVSKDNRDIVVNIFFSYSAEDEIRSGGGFDGKVDLLVRTSGEKRLSDFMLRGAASGTHIFFARCLWPELTPMHVYLLLIKHVLEVKYLIN